MNTQAKDELEVPGHVVVIETVKVKDLTRRAREIIDEAELEGYDKLGDIPEGKQKAELRGIFRALGQDVKF